MAPAAVTAPKKNTPGAYKDKSKPTDIRTSNINAAKAVADAIRTSLGPRGMDKMIQSGNGEVTITNDGATILKQINVLHPAAKMLVELSKAQDVEAGDGTTSVVVFAGELLREAEKLVGQNVHPQIIITGWREAVEVAKKALLASSIDNSKNPEKFKIDLYNIASTTLSSKILGHGYKHFFSTMAVDAVLRLKGNTDLNMIHIIKKLGGGLGDSFLDTGFILEKKNWCWAT